MFKVLYCINTVQQVITLHLQFLPVTLLVLVSAPQTKTTYLKPKKQMFSHLT